MQSLLSLLFLFTTTQTILQQQQNANDLWYFDYVDIVYREERWANESWLFSDNPRYKKEDQKNSIQTPNKRTKHEAWLKDQRIKYLQKTYPNEYKIQKTITHIWDKKLYRKQEYFYPKNKIIIHHSAMPTRQINTQADMLQYVKKIQELHTFYRDWWDIGYHFLIDKFGTIYEWRAGWPGVIGAHAQFNNFNSIGICLLWDFQKEYPSLKQIKSLITLLISLTNYYHIDSHQKVLYHAKSETAPYIKDFYDTPISYHKKVWLTACPWAHLLSNIPFIKNFVDIYEHTFNQQQNQKLLIDEIFQKLPMSANKEEIQTYLSYFQKDQIHNKTIQQTIPATREEKDSIISQRNTKLILPEDKTKQEAILTKYKDFLLNIAQNTTISNTQREYFISIFNTFIYHEQMFLNKSTNKNRALFYLYTKKLILNLKSLAN